LQTICSQQGGPGRRIVLGDYEDVEAIAEQLVYNPMVKLTGKSLSDTKTIKGCRLNARCNT